MAPTSDEQRRLLPCPFCGGTAHVRRRTRYRGTGRKGTVYDMTPYGEVESKVPLLEWSFGWQVWCGRCKAKMPYVFGPWHSYTDEELEELDREAFHTHEPGYRDEGAREIAEDTWNRRFDHAD